MSDYRIFQLLTYLTVYPTKWRELQGLPLQREPGPGLLDGGLAWLGRRMVALGEGLEVRYGRGAEAPAQPVSNWTGMAL